MNTTVSEIRYRDLARREAYERRRLEERLNQLDRSAKSRAGVGVGGKADPIFYSIEEKNERDRIEELLNVIATRPNEWCEPLWVAARDFFNGRSAMLIGRLDNPHGDVNSGSGVTLHKSDPNRNNLSAENASLVALTVGILVSDAAIPPPVRVDRLDIPPPTVPGGSSGDGSSDGSGTGSDGGSDIPGTPRATKSTTPPRPPGDDDDKFAINADRKHPDWPKMSRQFFAALGEAESYGKLALKVLIKLAETGTGAVDVEEYARVMRNLAAKGVTEDEPQLGRKIDEALDEVQSVGGMDELAGDIGINLPDLDSIGDSAIVADNVRLMGPVICGAMLDELKAFQVLDRIQDAAQGGTLPIGRGNAGRLLYKRWKEAPNRMSEAERRGLYAMTMGQPGGPPDGASNREFNDLWLRFISSVSSFVRQQDVDQLLRASLPSAIGAQQVRKAARDLASNLSLHGYGMTFYSAKELEAEVKLMVDTLSDREILSAYAARDMWQVIDQVATLELGGARTSSRYRTLATCGIIITAWLANNIEKIMRPTGMLIDMMDVRSPVPRSAGERATTRPTDYDLVNACELWLADTGTSEESVMQYSQSRETPVMTSKPVPIPAFAREFMEDIPGMGAGAAPGLGLGLGLRGGNGAMRH